MNLTLKVIPVELISEYWDQLAVFIEDAIKEAQVTEYGLEHIRQLLETGNWTAVGFFGPEAVMHGALTVTVQYYPHEHVAFVTAIGGRGLTNETNWQQLKDICRSAGCSKLQAYSRESVARLWGRIGFRNRATLVEADL